MRSVMTVTCKAATVAVTYFAVKTAGRHGVQLLVQRSKAVKHMGGMWVFPGGAVDEHDATPEADALVAGRTEPGRAETHPLLADEGRRQRFYAWLVAHEAAIFTDPERRPSPDRDSRSISRNE